MQLLVLGMHRSGSSALTRVLNLCGAYFGPEGQHTGANEENPKGFWERRDVRALNDHVLHSVGCDWNRISEFDVDKIPDALRREFNTRASRIVLDMDAYRPWVLKEPRLCVLLPLWRSVLECPVGIHIFRHPLEVAASLHRRNGIPPEVGVLLWRAYVGAALKGAGGMEACHVFHDTLINNPVATTNDLLRRLEQIGVRGLRQPALRELESFVSSELRHHRSGEIHPGTRVEKDAVALYERLVESPFDTSFADLNKEEKSILVAYEASLPDIKELKKDGSAASAQEALIFKLRQSSDEAHARALRAEGARDALRASVDAVNNQALVTAREIESGKMRADRLLLDISNYQRKVRVFEEAIARRESAIEDLKAEVAKTSAEKAVIEQRVAESHRMRREIEAGKERADRLLLDISNYQEKVKNFEEAIARRDSAIEELKVKVTSASAEQSEIEQRLVESHQLLEAEKSASSDLRRSLDAMRDEVDSLQLQLEGQNEAAVYAAGEAERAAQVLASERAVARARTLDLARLTRLLMTRDQLLLESEERAAQAEDLSTRYAIRLRANDKEIVKLRDLLASAEARSAGEKQLLLESEARTARAEEISSQYAGRLRASSKDVAKLRALLASTEARSAEEKMRLEARLTKMEASRIWRAGQFARRILDPVRRFRRGGRGARDAEELHRSGLFDPEWYCRTYLDVRESGMDPVQHYLEHGAGENRDPGPEFSSSGYVSRYPDVKISGINPLLHYVRHGKSEGRIAR